MDLPDLLSEIGDFAFDSCIRLKNVSIPSGLSELNQGLFYNCRELKEITIPGNILNINGNDKEINGIFENSGL